jgi:hypothetical protein
MLLDRAWFSVGEIDAKYGSNVRRAIAAFQRARDLTPTGTVDASTGRRSSRDGPVLVPYQITPEDVAGPFMRAPEDMMKKAKLPALYFASPLEALAERFHASPALLTELNPGASSTSPARRSRCRASRIAVPPPAAEIRVDDHDDRSSARRRERQDDRALSGDHRQPARSAAARTMEGERRLLESAVPLQPAAVLGSPDGPSTRDDPARTEQSGGRRLDRPLEGALRHPRDAGARPDLAHVTRTAASG